MGLQTQADGAHAGAAAAAVAAASAATAAPDDDEAAAQVPYEREREAQLWVRRTICTTQARMHTCARECVRAHKYVRDHISRVACWHACAAWHKFKFKNEQPGYARTHARTHAHMHARTHARTHACTHTHARTHARTHAHANCTCRHAHRFKVNHHHQHQVENGFGAHWVPAAHPQKSMRSAATGCPLALAPLCRTATAAHTTRPCFSV